VFGEGFVMVGGDILGRWLVELSSSGFTGLCLFGLFVMNLGWGLLDCSGGWYVSRYGSHTCQSCRRLNGGNGCLSLGFRCGRKF